jgi:glucose/arabinose dehydrogenase
MNRYIRLLAAPLAAVLIVPLGAQQNVPAGRGGTPVAPQGISRLPPLPATPVRYETAEGQTIRVSVYARGFQNPWSMAWVSNDTVLVAERGGAIKGYGPLHRSESSFRSFRAAAHGGVSGSRHHQGLSHG